MNNTTETTPQPSQNLSDEEFHRRNKAWWDRVKAMSLEEQRQVLIRIGALTPEGKLPVYPMDDHVPYGPRS